ncbi:hypothetical protein [Actinoplanes aureus]|uniref:Uncharacterized protein n=1 Tax=Actinoplanes aureus TaxID=2792083 RepID=A0A931C010_9ACTN|nr:hypothetical protein [Actinoplanes aureus]MBG0560739.1 hypothetical protein [Actinoplanes aureus]
MVKVPFGANLDSRQRMEVAKMTGHADRLIQALGWSVGDEAVAELHAISTDPVVYGIALGTTRAMIETGGWDHLGPLAELYEACGADEEVADRQKAWRLAQPWTT